MNETGDPPPSIRHGGQRCWASCRSSSQRRVLPIARRQGTTCGLAASVALPFIPTSDRELRLTFGAAASTASPLPHRGGHRGGVVGTAGAIGNTASSPD